MEDQSQHLKEVQLNELLKLLQRLEFFSDGTLGTRKIDTVELKLKDYTKMICSIPYP